MRYIFANCEIDTRYGVIRNGAQERSLAKRPFEILCYLLQHANRSVPRQELVEQFWTDRDPTEATVLRTMRTVRRSIGDNLRNPRMIQYDAAQGYRFIVPVTEIAEENGAIAHNGRSAEAITRAPASESPALEDEIAPPRASPSLNAKAPASSALVRRQLSVLFCNFVASADDAPLVDPEDYLEAIQAYHDACALIIARFEGHLVKPLGQGLLVYFGYPQAHEDNAQRAIYSALAMLEEIAFINGQAQLRHGVILSVQIGIHTGVIVSSAQWTRSQEAPLAIGEAPLIAMRLSERLAPNTIGVSAATYHLVHGHVSCQLLGDQKLHGLPESIKLYQVLHKHGALSRFEATLTTRTMTPMVGRENELNLLLGQWRQAQEGFGAGLCISGDAGMGKSRLVQALKDQMISRSYTLLECQTSPYDQQTAFRPLISLVEQLCEWEPHAPWDMKVKKLELFLSQFTLPPGETLALFASLLSLTSGASDEPLRQMSPPQRRQRLMEAFLTIFLELAEQQPTLLVVEDLQWADTSTLDMLSLLIDQASSARMLILLTFRSDFHPSLKTRLPMTHLMISSLTSRQVEQMILQITNGKPLPEEVRQQLVAKTDGLPLFVEEMTRMVMDSGLIRENDDNYELATDWPALDIPATLRDSLMARLDHLERGQETAQLAATIGREFSFELIRAIATVNESALQQDLNQLVKADILYQRGLQPQSHYYFKHALIQETAYQSLSRETRRRHHQRIAHVLEQVFPEICATHPERLAYHYTEANLSQQSIVHWQQAAQQALKRNDLAGATAHARQGLAALSTLPPTTENRQHELSFQITLCKAFVAPGAARSERNQAYRRAYDLCEEIGNVQQRFEVFGGLGNWYLARAELTSAHEIGQQLLELAQRENDSTLLRKAQRDISTTLFFLGSPIEAMQHINRALPVDVEQTPDNLTVQYRHISETALLRYQSWIKHLIGYPNQAFLAIQQALQLSQYNELSFGLDMLFKLTLHQWRRELDAMHPLADEVIHLAQDKYPMLRARGLIIKGWRVAQEGAAQDGIDLVRRGIADYRATGSELFIPYFMALLAEIYGQTSDLDAGLDTIWQALELTHRTGEQCWESELHRLYAKFLLSKASANATQAEAEYQQAITIARHQQCKTLELRAVTSLCQLWRDQGKRHQAISLLEPVYNWFTEGHDTIDLKDAKTLLSELQ